MRDCKDREDVREGWGMGLRDMNKIIKTIKMVIYLYIATYRQN